MARVAPTIPTSPAITKPKTRYELVGASPAVGRTTPPTLQPAETVSWTVVWWKTAPESPDTEIVYVYSGVEVDVEIARLKLTVWPEARVSVDGIGDSVGPLLTVGSTLLARLTVPAKPSTL